MFPSKHLPKDYVFKHSTFYTRDTIKRENNLPLLPNSLNLLLVSLWGKVVSPRASSTSASTSFCPWSSASISSWAWSPSTWSMLSRVGLSCVKPSRLVAMSSWNDLPPGQAMSGPVKAEPSQPRPRTRLVDRSPGQVGMGPCHVDSTRTHVELNLPKSS